MIKNHLQSYVWLCYTLKSNDQKSLYDILSWLIFKISFPLKKIIETEQPILFMQFNSS